MAINSKSKLTKKPSEKNISRFKSSKDRTSSRTKPRANLKLAKLSVESPIEGDDDIKERHIPRKENVIKKKGFEKSKNFAQRKSNVRSSKATKIDEDSDKEKPSHKKSENNFRNTEIFISGEEDGMRLDRFLREKFRVPQSLIEKSLRSRLVLLFMLNKLFEVQYD
jgi:hypothetical protein